MVTWDPARYLRFRDERSRPFAELIARVEAEPGSILDLGCGPGHLSGLLRARWPDASILGLDSSPEMVAAARRDHAAAGVTYALGDLRTWSPETPVDLVVSNATLQWAPDHLRLLPHLAAMVAPGGHLAFSVPGNFTEPSHVLLRNLADEEPYRRWTAEVEHPSAHGAATYLDTLASLGWEVDAWETTYQHVLTGEDAVFDWISGTGARPVLEALPDDVREQFAVIYKQQLRDAYPAQAYGTVLPFRRVFVVAHRRSVASLSGTGHKRHGIAGWDRDS